MLEFINTYILGILTPVLLVVAGVYFSFKLKFFYLFHPIKLVKSMLHKSPTSGISPFRAVTLALAGTLGVGNIVGVASAIALGGFGAVFWMWVSAIFAMVLKYAEIVLAINHRRVDKESCQYVGGAMYYIKDFFISKKKFLLGAFIAGIFALLCLLNSFTMGCVVQINAVSRAFLGVFDAPLWAVGAVMAVLCFVVVLGNAKFISGFTEKTIPIMTVGYIFISFAVFVLKPQGVSEAFGLIFEDAFNFDSVAFGVLGFLFSRAVRFGVMRGLMSNEGGCGTAPIAHAVSNTNSPHNQGVWGIFEVFVDTILLCTMTAIVIIISWDSVFIYANDPMIMTIKAYSAVLGVWAEYFVSISVVCFAFATIICWAHYGKECVRYFTRKKIYSFIYIVIFCLFVLFGAVVAPDSVWAAADFAIGMMVTINVPVLLGMSGEIVGQKELN